MIFEVGKEYVTRDGRRARVYATDGGGVDVIHGAIEQSRTMDGWRSCVWEANGRLCQSVENAGDLIPPRPPVVVSDAVLTAHLKARGFLADDLSRFEDARAHLVMVITAYLAEQEPR